MDADLLEEEDFTDWQSESFCLKVLCEHEEVCREFLSSIVGEGILYSKNTALCLCFNLECYLQPFALCFKS